MKSPDRSLGTLVETVGRVVDRRVDWKAVVRRSLDAVAVGSLVVAGLTLLGVVPEQFVRAVAEAGRPLVIGLGAVTLAAVLLARGVPGRRQSEWDRQTESPDPAEEQASESATSAEDGATAANTESRHRWESPLRRTAPEAVSLSGNVRPHAPVTVVAGEEDRLAHDIVAKLSEEGKAREQLWSVAVETVADGTDPSVERAEMVVESGEWTDDPRAAAYLSPEDQRLPVGVRLRDWLVGEPTARQVRATVGAITEQSRAGSVAATELGGLDGLGPSDSLRSGDDVDDGAVDSPATAVDGSATDAAATADVSATDAAATADATATPTDQSVRSGDSDAENDADDTPVELGDEQVRNAGALRWEVER